MVINDQIGQCCNDVEFQCCYTTLNFNVVSMLRRCGKAITKLFMK